MLMTFPINANLCLIVMPIINNIPISINYCQFAKGCTYAFIHMALDYFQYRRVSNTTIHAVSNDI